MGTSIRATARSATSQLVASVSVLVRDSVPSYARAHLPSPRARVDVFGAPNVTSQIVCCLPLLVQASVGWLAGCCRRAWGRKPRTWNLEKRGQGFYLFGRGGKAVTLILPRSSRARHRSRPACVCLARQRRAMSLSTNPYTYTPQARQDDALLAAQLPSVITPTAVLGAINTSSTYAAAGGPT